MPGVPILLTPLLHSITAINSMSFLISFLSLRVYPDLVSVFEEV